MKAFHVALLAAVLAGCGGGGDASQPQVPAPPPPAGFQSAKIVNRGPAGLTLVTTVEMDSTTLKYASAMNGATLKTWSQAVTPAEFSQLKKIVEDEDLYLALKVPPKITSNPCHHEGMEVTLKKDDVATVFPIHYLTVCDTTTNKGFRALFDYVDGLATKYAPK